MGANVSKSSSSTTTVDDSTATNGFATTTGTATASADPTAVNKTPTAITSKPFQQWSSEELAQAISNRGSSDLYKQYSERVLQEGVDGSLLWHMKESEFLETLTDLDVTNRLHVRVLTHDWKHAVEYAKRIQLATQLASKYRDDMNNSNDQQVGKGRTSKRKTTKAGNKNVKSSSSSTFDDYAAMLSLLQDNNNVINPLLPPPRRKVGQRGCDVVERKKRRCLRCLKYGGGGRDDDNTNASTCKGRVGRLGSNACMYFEEDGTPKRSQTHQVEATSNEN